eukprot:GHVQ01030547.1.p1 GENE.GHVQ01030547.1~~GHVQ01030547.1.p1  ORF type:complete len:889 (+),score=87.62 GHVQ01030547.1:44-2668(+)
MRSSLTSASSFSPPLLPFKETTSFPRTPSNSTVPSSMPHSLDTPSDRRGYSEGKTIKKLPHLVLPISHTTVQHSIHVTPNNPHSHPPTTTSNSPDNVPLPSPTASKLYASCPLDTTRSAPPWQNHSISGGPVLSGSRRTSDAGLFAAGGDIDLSCRTDDISGATGIPPTRLNVDAGNVHCSTAVQGMNFGKRCVYYYCDDSATVCRCQMQRWFDKKIHKTMPATPTLASYYSQPPTLPPCARANRVYSNNSHFLVSPHNRNASCLNSYCPSKHIQHAGEAPPSLIGLSDSFCRSILPLSPGQSNQTHTNRLFTTLHSATPASPAPTSGCLIHATLPSTAPSPLCSLTTRLAQRLCSEPLAHLHTRSVNQLPSTRNPHFPPPHQLCHSAIPALTPHSAVVSDPHKFGHLHSRSPSHVMVGTHSRAETQTGCQRKIDTQRKQCTPVQGSRRLLSAPAMLGLKGSAQPPRRKFRGRVEGSGRTFTGLGRGDQLGMSYPGLKLAGRDGGRGALLKGGIGRKLSLDEVTECSDVSSDCKARRDMAALLSNKDSWTESTKRRGWGAIWCGGHGTAGEEYGRGRGRAYEIHNEGLKLRTKRQDNLDEREDTGRESRGGLDICRKVGGGLFSICLGDCVNVGDRGRRHGETGWWLLEWLGTLLGRGRQIEENDISYKKCEQGQMTEARRTDGELNRNGKSWVKESKKGLREEMEQDGERVVDGLPVYGQDSVVGLCYKSDRCCNRRRKLLLQGDIIRLNDLCNCTYQVRRAPASNCNCVLSNRRQYATSASNTKDVSLLSVGMKGTRCNSQTGGCLCATETTSGSIPLCCLGRRVDLHRIVLIEPDNDSCQFLRSIESHAHTHEHVRKHIRHETKPTRRLSQ